MSFYKILFPFVLANFFAVSTVFSQNTEFRSTITTPVGFNGWQIVALADELIKADSVIGAYMKATPTFALSYDYALVDWFSLGAQFSWNRGKIGADNLTVTIKEKQYTGKAELVMRRVNIGIRPLFHYPTNSRVDCYSGFRIGMSYVRTKVDIGTDQDITESEVLDYLIGDNWLLNRSYRRVRPSAQFIPLGMRFYPIPNLGLGFETAIGATYFLSAQVNYRF